LCPVRTALFSTKGRRASKEKYKIEENRMGENLVKKKGKYEERGKPRRQKISGRRRSD
jgi:hypothetical protein